MHRFGRIPRILATLVLALALALGIGAHRPPPAAAYGYSVGISACSYAENYCVLRFCAYGQGTVYVTWYVTTYGVSGQRYTQVQAFNGCFVLTQQYIGPATYANWAYINCPQICERFEIYVNW